MCLVGVTNTSWEVEWKVLPYRQLQSSNKWLSWWKTAIAAVLRCWVTSALLSNAEKRFPSYLLHISVRGNCTVWRMLFSFLFLTLPFLNMPAVPYTVAFTWSTYCPWRACARGDRKHSAFHCIGELNCPKYCVRSTTAAFWRQVLASFLLS